MSADILDILHDRYDALLVANGTPVKRRLLSLLHTRANHVIALDGGVNSLFRYKVAPELVAGDLDSATKEALAWAKANGARIRRLSLQESPDIAKGIEFCSGKGFERVIVTGFSGERLDHVLASLSYVFSIKGVEITLVTNDVLGFPLRGRIERAFEIPTGHCISWFAFPKAGPCSLSGVRWPFHNRTLSADGFHSLSNQPVTETVHLSQSAGRSIFFVSLRPQVPA